MNKFLIGAAALGGSIAAGAQMTPPTVQTQMATLPGAPYEANGRVQTRDEVIAKMRTHFAKLDTNRDGFIDRNELQAMHAQHDQRMGAGDGHHGANEDVTTRDGAMGNPGAIFDRLDTNRDGMLSRDEFAKGRELRIERKVVMNDGDEHGEMAKQHARGGMGSRMLEMADTNKDGRISLQEMTAMALQRFDRVDANHDGKITPEERKAMHHPGL